MDHRQPHHLKGSSGSMVVLDETVGKQMVQVYSLIGNLRLIMISTEIPLCK